MSDLVVLAGQKGWVAFPPIGPSPVRDYRTADFSAVLVPLPPGAPISGGGPVNPPGLIDIPDVMPTASIVNAAWSIYLEEHCVGLDPYPDTRLIGAPFWDATSTTHLIGDCVAGCTYLFNIHITLDDERILLKQASMACISVSYVARVLKLGEIPFDYDEFISKFPEFMGFPENMMQSYWDNACLLFRNDATSPCLEPTARRDILNLITAHCAALFAPAPYGRGGINATVGVITSKSVDGVSIGSSGPPGGVTGTAMWYLQTQYGAKAWKLTAAYRSFHYVQGPQRYPYPPNNIWPPNTAGYGRRGW